MAKHMGRKVTAVIISAIIVAGCSRSEDSPQEGQPSGGGYPSSTMASPSPSPTVQAMPTVRSAPEIQEGISEEAAAATAQTFVEMWATFSPSNLNPKQDWFDSWDKWATPDFRRDMRVSADRLWSWTWNRSEKACCVEFPMPAEVTVGEEEAIAKVTLTRWILPLFATQADFEENMKDPEGKTYMVTMVVDGDRLLVSDVREAVRDEKLPEVR